MLTIADKIIALPTNTAWQQAVQYKYVISNCIYTTFTDEGRCYVFKDGSFLKE